MSIFTILCTYKCFSHLLVWIGEQLSHQWPLIKSYMTFLCVRVCVSTPHCCCDPTLYLCLHLPRVPQKVEFSTSHFPVEAEECRQDGASPQEYGISALTVCWCSRLAHNMSGSLTLPPGPLLSYDCKVWPCPAVAAADHREDLAECRSRTRDLSHRHRFKFVPQPAHIAWMMLSFVCLRSFLRQVTPRHHQYFGEPIPRCFYEKKKTRQ